LIDGAMTIGFAQCLVPPTPDRLLTASGRVPRARMSVAATGNQRSVERISEFFRALSRRVILGSAH